MWVILIKIRDDHSISFRAIFEIPLTCLTMKPHWVSLGESNETQWEPSEVLQLSQARQGVKRSRQVCGGKQEKGKWRTRPLATKVVFLSTQPNMLYCFPGCLCCCYLRYLGTLKSEQWVPPAEPETLLINSPSPRFWSVADTVKTQPHCALG